MNIWSLFTFRGRQRERRADAFLYRIPPEVWLQIFRYFGDEYLVFERLAHTCHFFRELCQPLQYRTLYFGYGTETVSEALGAVIRRDTVWPWLNGPRTRGRGFSPKHRKRSTGQIHFYQGKLHADYYLTQTSPTWDRSFPHPPLFFLDDPASPTYGCIKNAEVCDDHSLFHSWNDPLHHCTILALSRMRHLRTLLLRLVQVDRAMLDLVHEMSELEELTLFHPYFDTFPVSSAVQAKCELKALSLIRPYDSRGIGLAVLLSQPFCENLQRLDLQNYYPARFYSAVGEHLKPDTLRSLRVSWTGIESELTSEWSVFLGKQSEIASLRIFCTGSFGDICNSPTFLPKLREWQGSPNQAQVLKGRPVEKVVVDMDRPHQINAQQLLSCLSASRGPIRTLVFRSIALEPWMHERLSVAVPHLKSLSLFWRSSYSAALPDCTEETAWLAPFKSLTHLDIAYFTRESDRHPVYSALLEPAARRLIADCPTLCKLTLGTRDYVYVGDRFWRAYSYGKDVELVSESFALVW